MLKDNSSYKQQQQQKHIYQEMIKHLPDSYVPLSSSFLMS